jgi:hypothetical protein
MTGVFLLRFDARKTWDVCCAGSLLPTGITRSSTVAELLMKVSPSMDVAFQPCTRMPLAGLTRNPSESTPNAPARLKNVSSPERRVKNPSP